jgi:hypothetical protein
MIELGRTSALARHAGGDTPATISIGDLVLRECRDVAIATLTIDLDRRPHLRDRVEAALGHKLPTATRPTGDPMLVWQSPSDLIAFGEPDAIAAMMSRIADALDGAPALIAPANAGLVMIALSGRGAEAICPLPIDAPSGMLRTTATRIGDLRVTMIRHAAPGERIGLIVERPDADALWRWLIRKMEMASAAD